MVELLRRASAREAAPAAPSDFYEISRTAADRSVVTPRQVKDCFQGDVRQNEDKNSSTSAKEKFVSSTSKSRRKTKIRVRLKKKKRSN